MSPGSFVGAFSLERCCFGCHYFGPCGPRCPVRVHSLSVASEASRKSLTKAFKEEEKTLKALVQGVYQGKKYLQALSPDDYFEFDE
jgi:hypothetical protein